MTKKNNTTLTVIGAGLAGCEAAYQATKKGCHVRLIEMKPKKFTPAHHFDGFAELVCSNSLRSNELSNAIGLLKEEMLRMDSLIMNAAYATKVPAGSSLAVDREAFSEYITDRIKENPNIEIIEDEATKIPTEGITVIATGPLTSDSLAEEISRLTDNCQLHFYDAAAPIIDFSSVDMSRAFFASRYGKGEGSDYLNCPMTKEEYDAFYHALISAKEAELKEFDSKSQKDLTVFEGCMPVEVMAKRGYDTLRFGPMKPVGLPCPDTGNDAYATVQLRKENNEGTMFNIVGFQTHLTFPEQRRVFRMIPGLENAQFLRYGVMHRNTYLDSPNFLMPDYSVKKNQNLFFAGQMTGVEGYIESASSGFVAGVNAARRALGENSFVFDRKTVIGALAHYVAYGSAAAFQPMNANFGIVEPLDYKVKGGKKAKNEEIAKRSLNIIDTISF
ncbi:MAG: methylenetetrahydrofolate--tRNA-(uracil(54)-C(5))-methyltransferase (FADH(2)-oxidizing) TrmFO [Eubacteriales bacterium]|nr:methylenetetrahydrofolate--tRNA-(uracil(54)-C(5))-methyltransferase (FADH(2)-oxidizing) TrmFO [Eubacteriales bacterium]